MLQCLRDMQHASVMVEGGLQRDLAWFRKFVRLFNGTTFANWAGSHDHEEFVDASLMGLGGVWNNAFYSCSLPVYVKSQERIVVFEMLNILIALRVWGHKWKDSRVVIWCDNRVVVDVLGGNRTRDGELGALLREILLEQALSNIQVTVKHVRGENNPIADALSRVHMGKSVDCKRGLANGAYRRSGD